MDCREQGGVEGEEGEGGYQFQFKVILPERHRTTKSDQAQNFEPITENYPIRQGTEFFDNNSEPNHQTMHRILTKNREQPHQTRHRI